MASVVGVMQHLGMNRPPFPQAGPASPPSAQSGVSSYDGAGTLGMYPGDTDDDSEESSEDEEGEYESSD